jgi:hypothetical protein
MGHLTISILLVISILFLVQMTEVMKHFKVNTPDWQTTSCTVAQRFQKLFELAEWADCKFLVGSDEPRTVRHVCLNGFSFTYLPTYLFVFGLTHLYYRGPHTYLLGW